MGEPKGCEPAYSADGVVAISTSKLFAVCVQLGVAGETPNATYKPPGLLRRLFRR
jgi:hypothetical protein